MRYDYITDFDDEQEEIEDYDFFNEGYPGDQAVYSDFYGWRDMVL